MLTLRKEFDSDDFTYKTGARFTKPSEVKMPFKCCLKRISYSFILAMGHCYETTATIHFRIFSYSSLSPVALFGGLLVWYTNSRDGFSSGNEMQRLVLNFLVKRPSIGTTQTTRNTELNT